jgi:four helix bundle protein
MSTELENRFHNFSISVRNFCLRCKRDVINLEYMKQVVRSSGSVAANYIEAVENLGIADERMKLKISRKEAKESTHWLDLMLTYGDIELDKERLKVMDESNQITKILSNIIIKVEARNTTKNKA